MGNIIRAPENFLVDLHLILSSQEALGDATSSLEPSNQVSSADIPDSEGRLEIKFMRSFSRIPLCQRSVYSITKPSTPQKH